MNPQLGCPWDVGDRVSYNGYNGTVTAKSKIGGGYRLTVHFDVDGSKVPIACHRLQAPMAAHDGRDGT